MQEWITSDEIQKPISTDLSPHTCQFSYSTIIYLTGERVVDGENEFKALIWKLAYFKN